MSLAMMVEYFASEEERTEYKENLKKNLVAATNHGDFKVQC
jgi:hypothetical protein